MDKFLRRAWMEIDLDCIKYNYERIKSIIPKETRIMAVVKANSYNLGDITIAKTLEEFKEDWYAVSNINEAIQLRKAGIEKNILVLGYTPLEDYWINKINKYNITQTAISYEYAEILNIIGEKLNCIIKVHIKLDTGMSRLGIECYDEKFDIALEKITKICSMKFLKVTGIFTHVATFYETDDFSEELSRIQCERFVKITNKLSYEGWDIGLRHCCNSAGIVNMPDMALDMVRTGTLIFGGMTKAYSKKQLDFKETVSIKAVVSCVKYLKKGSYVSYSQSFKAEKDMRLAVVTIGYSDVCRIGDGEGKIIVNGALCPVIGSVCMDQLMVDISLVEDVKVGDEVVILGSMNNSEITIEEFAKFMDTEPNEAYCHITKRLSQVYVENKNIISWTEYISENIKLK